MDISRGEVSAAFFEMNKLLITRQNSQVLLSAISLLAFNLNIRHLKPVMVLFQPDLVQPQVIKAMDHGVTWPISLVRVTTVVCILSARFFQPLLPRATSKLISILLTPGLPMAA